MIFDRVHITCDKNRNARFILFWVILNLFYHKRSKTKYFIIFLGPTVTENIKSIFDIIVIKLLEKLQSKEYIDILSPPSVSGCVTLCCDDSERPNYNYTQLCRVTFTSFICTSSFVSSYSATATTVLMLGTSQGLYIDLCCSNKPTEGCTNNTEQQQNIS